MINTKKFQHLNKYSAYKHEEWEGYSVCCYNITTAYEIAYEWAKENGYTLLNLCFVMNELFITYETNKELGEE